jgi:hypothetical protein
LARKILYWQQKKACAFWQGLYKRIKESMVALIALPA